MTGERTLLLFAGDGAMDRWLAIADGRAVDRGGDWITAPADDPGGVRRVVLVVPGTAVSIHWIELPALNIAQARAAARLSAAEVSLDPIERLHVAIGARDADGYHPMAVIEGDRLAGWLAAAQALALDPDRIVPEPLLIAPPEEGERHWRREDAVIVRGPMTAYAAEPELVALLAQSPVEMLDDAGAEAGFNALLDPPLVDLRQGVFARRRRWRVDWAQLRRIGWVGLGLLAVTLAIQIALLVRYDAASDRAEAEIETVARGALPRASALPNPPAQLAERLAQLRGGGLGYGTLAGLLFGAVRDTANVELGAMQFDRTGTLTTTVLATDPSEIAALEARLDAAGLDAAAGPPRSGGGRQIAELTVRAR